MTAPARPTAGAMQRCIWPVVSDLHVTFPQVKSDMPRTHPGGRCHFYKMDAGSVGPYSGRFKLNSPSTRV